MAYLFRKSAPASEVQCLQCWWMSGDVPYAQNSSDKQEHVLSSLEVSKQLLTHTCPAGGSGHWQAQRLARDVPADLSRCEGEQPALSCWLWFHIYQHLLPQIELRLCIRFTAALQGGTCLLLGDAHGAIDKAAETIHKALGCKIYKRKKFYREEGYDAVRPWIPCSSARSLMLWSWSGREALWMK